MERKNKCLLVIIPIVIIILILILIVLRKIVIFNEIKRKAEQYEQYNNIYCKTESEISTIEKYILGNSNKIVVKYKDKPVTSIQITHGKEQNMYQFYETSKKVTITNTLTGTSEKVPIITNYANTKTFMDKIFKSKISIEKIEEKKYYVIDSLTNEDFLHLNNVVSRKVYIEKETGLPYRIVEITKGEDNNKKEHIVNIKYEFNVSKDIFEEPDMTGYEIN